MADLTRFRSPSLTHGPVSTEPAVSPKPVITGPSGRRSRICTGPLAPVHVTCATPTPFWQSTMREGVRVKVAGAATWATPVTGSS